MKMSEIALDCWKIQGYFIRNDCPIAVGVGDVVECATSLITSVGLVSPIDGDTGGIGNLSNIA
jgi:hypothetical protein